MNEQQTDREPSNMTPAWSVEDGDAAALEGWGIFDSLGSENGPWQVQRIDDVSDSPVAPQLETDDEAWRLVLKGEKPHHIAAMEFISKHNATEYEALMVFAEKEEITVGHVPGFSSPRVIAQAATETSDLMA